MAKNESHGLLPASVVAVLAELIATGLLVMLGCMSCVHFKGGAEPSLLQIVLAFGLAVMFLVQIFGHVSGAHMNPAVTLASVLMKLTPPVLGVCYAVAQCAGAIIGFGLLTAVIPELDGEQASQGLCTTHPHKDISVFQALIVEITISTVLIFLCGAFWDPINKHNTDSLALKFGLTITGLSLAGGPFTGSSMNPARSLAPAIWSNEWTDHWVYWVGPVFGAVLGAMVYKLVFQSRPQLPPADPSEELPLSSQKAGGAA